MTNDLRRVLASLVNVVLLGLVLTSCHKDQPANENSPPSPASLQLRLGYIPILDCSQVYVASGLGYFGANHLEIELVPMPGGPAVVQALASGAIDIGFANLATVVFYEQASPALSRLAGGTRMDGEHSEAGLVVTADSGIKSISDLRGKTIAVNSRRNIVDLAVIRAAKASNLSPADFTLVELPFKDMEAALRAKKIDAATLPEPNLSSAMKTPGLLNLGDHFALAFGEVYSAGYFAMPNSSKITPQVSERFQSAISRATQDLAAPNESTYKAISSRTKLSIELLASSGKPEFVVSLPEVAFTKMQNWLKEEGMLVNR